MSSFLLTALMVIGMIGGQEIGPPDVNNFKPTLSKELEFRIDDYKTAFVGKIVVYQNQNDLNDFVRVYYRQIAIVSGRPKEVNGSGPDGRNVNMSNLNYHRREETEALHKVQLSMDPFIYIQWRTKRDPRTGQDIRDGPYRVWTLNQESGNLVFNSDQDVLSIPFSEPSKTDPKKNVPVGIKFSVGGSEVHIIRIDQDDLRAATKEVSHE